MSSTIALFALIVSFQLRDVAAWSSLMIHNNNKDLSRRDVLQQVAASVMVGGAVVTAPAVPAYAEVTDETPRVTTRMGGLLEAFQDGPRSIRMMAPSGWNKFDGEVGAFDLKWQDLVDPTENIKVTSTPVKSTTDSIAVLGNVQDLGVSLATKRNAKLIAAEERLTDEVLFYKFEFGLDDGTHQLLQLCVCRGKLWSVDANAKEKRWAKREDLYQNVLASFMPKLA